jgi:hypothetical protein
MIITGYGQRQNGSKRYKDCIFAGGRLLYLHPSGFISLG